MNHIHTLIPLFSSYLIFISLILHNWKHILMISLVNPFFSFFLNTDHTMLIYLDITFLQSIPFLFIFLISFILLLRFLQKIKSLQILNLHFYLEYLWCSKKLQFREFFMRKFVIYSSSDLQLFILMLFQLIVQHLSNHLY